MAYPLFAATYGPLAIVNAWERPEILPVDEYVAAAHDGGYRTLPQHVRPYIDGILWSVNAIEMK